MALNLPPKTNDVELDRWLFELYNEARASFYQTQTVLQNADGDRFIISIDADDNVIATEIT